MNNTFQLPGKPFKPLSLVSIVSRPQASAWVLLAVWLAIKLNVVIYWANRDWGFLGDLWLLFLYAGSAAAFCVWIAAWAILSDGSLAVRAAYFVLGLGLLAGITAPMIEWWQDTELAVALAAVIVGNGVALVLVRLRGWQLRLQKTSPAIADGQVPEASMQVSSASKTFQFSLLELLLLMTGIASVLALLLIVGGPPEPGEAVVVADHIACGPVILITTLAWGSYVRAVVTSFVFSLGMTTSAIALVEPRSILEPVNWLVILLYAGPALVSLWIAALVVRGRGYRLTRLNLKPLVDCNCQTGCLD